jgi:DNA-directed RNA polymerase subunit RPC12/RpoP
MPDALAGASSEQASTSGGCIFSSLRSVGTAQRKNMTSIPDGHQEQCPRCGSKLVNIEWDERVNAQEVQTLRHCLTCKNEFVALEASKQEQPASDAEVTKPFFTSLVIE